MPEPTLENTHPPSMPERPPKQSTLDTVQFESYNAPPATRASPAPEPPSEVQLRNCVSSQRMVLLPTSLYTRKKAPPPKSTACVSSKDRPEVSQAHCSHEWSISSASPPPKENGPVVWVLLKVMLRRAQLEATAPLLFSSCTAPPLPTDEEWWKDTLVAFTWLLMVWPFTWYDTAPPPQSESSVPKHRAHSKVESTRLKTVPTASPTPNCRAPPSLMDTESMTRRLDNVQLTSRATLSWWMHIDPPLDSLRQ
mmetsp:Transcript_12712/g.40618  ORF Transcript_12712/g.40618 Transcript_12712/m.40618 type:complete len:252 (+) Transcript_12712:1127-1882(+)